MAAGVVPVMRYSAALADATDVLLRLGIGRDAHEAIDGFWTCVVGGERSRDVAAEAIELLARVLRAALEDASLALPVTNPWLFFADDEVELSDADTARVGSETPDVWVTVRTGAAPQDFSANLRAPILVADGRGHQVINEASDAPVRAPLFSDAAVGQAA